MVQTVAKDYRIKPGTWGESKVRVQIMFTPTALNRIDAVADKMQLTRSEVIERLARSECLDAESLSQISGDRGNE